MAVIECAKCRKKEEGSEDPKFKTCAKCLLHQYCSKECQVSDWPNHKVLCKVVSKARKASAPKGDVHSNFTAWRNSKNFMLFRLYQHLYQDKDPSTHAICIYVKYKPNETPQFSITSAKADLLTDAKFDNKVFTENKVMDQVREHLCATKVVTFFFIEDPATYAVSGPLLDLQICDEYIPASYPKKTPELLTAINSQLIKGSAAEGKFDEWLKLEVMPTMDDKEKEKEKK